VTDFWVGAGAAATIILAAIAVVQFLRSRSNLLVEIKPYPWALPVTAQRNLKGMSELIGPGGVLAPQVDDKVVEKLDAVVDLFGARFGSHEIDTFWQIRIVDRGHERAEGVELHLPGAVQIQAKRGETANIGDGDRIVIGDVRPGEAIDVVAWGRQVFFAKPSIMQSKGRATIRTHGVVGPIWVFGSDFWKYTRWPLMIFAITLGVVTLVIRLIR